MDQELADLPPLTPEQEAEANAYWLLAYAPMPELTPEEAAEAEAMADFYADRLAGAR